MRFHLAAIYFLSPLSGGTAFVPSSQRSGLSRQQGVVPLYSTIAEKKAVADVTGPAPSLDSFSGEESTASTSDGAPVWTGAEIKSRLERQLEKLRIKDGTSTQLTEEDLNIVYEDHHIVVVDKPSGVLTVAGKGDYPNLAQAVCDSIGSDMGQADRMVVHRLGMDTSGLIVFAKTLAAVRGMNELFRTRSVDRKYEALVCGHVEKDQGMINLPVMRDYEFPPYMRISTDDHQRILLGVDPEEVGSKKLFEAPKESLTKYEVISREELDGQPVTRVSLTSISGRTHQLNVHLAAFGHPIVGDTTYGIGGVAATNGGLSDAEQKSLAPNPARASDDLQKQITSATAGKPASIHAKSLKFRHPITKKSVELSTDSPF